MAAKPTRRTAIELMHSQLQPIYAQDPSIKGLLTKVTYRTNGLSRAEILNLLEAVHRTANLPNKGA